MMLMVSVAVMFLDGLAPSYSDNRDSKNIYIYPQKCERSTSLWDRVTHVYFLQHTRALMFRLYCDRTMKSRAPVSLIIPVEPPIENGPVT